MFALRLSGSDVTPTGNAKHWLDFHPSSLRSAPPFSSIYTPAGAASGGRTIEVSSLTPAATPALIERVPDEVMTWSFVLNHCH